MRRITLPSLPPKYVRALRAAAWNLLFIISGLLLIALAGEMYLRLANPFLNNEFPYLFVDRVGIIREPNAELYYADWHDDNFVVSRANSQGFLDREPAIPDRAADGCRIVFIGDSYVEATHVPIADKFHVRLEEMAARQLPHLDIATQAYGIGNTGQIQQLPFYDEYARRLNPKLLVLVFYFNDFYNNSTPLYSLGNGVDPDRMPFMSAQKDESGALKLRPPDPEYRRFRLPMPPKAWHESAIERLVGVSYFAKWLDINKGWALDRIEALRAITSAPAETDPHVAAWANIIAARPCCASLLDDWQPASSVSLANPFSDEHMPPVYQEALEYTAFGIDQFKRRADRDGAKLAILSATGDVGAQGYPPFDRLNAIAQPRRIPIINGYRYILKQGYNEEEGRWLFNGHWNPTGHQWVAEAVLEWLKENQDVCD